MSDVSTRNSNRSRFALGVFLILLGGVLLAANLGYELPRGWWRFYPFIFFGFGLVGLIWPSRHLDRSGAVWLIATGVYCAIGVFNFYNLDWSDGWPVFVIAAGVSFMIHRTCDREIEPPAER